MGADCKSVGFTFDGSNPSLATRRTGCLRAAGPLRFRLGLLGFSGAPPLGDSSLSPSSRTPENPRPTSIERVYDPGEFLAGRPQEGGVGDVGCTGAAAHQMGVAAHLHESIGPDKRVTGQAGRGGSEQCG